VTLNRSELKVLNDLIRRGFPPFTINVKAVKNQTRQPLRDQGRYRPDAELELEWGGQRRRFVVECKASATPKQLGEALTQLREYMGQYTRAYGGTSGRNSRQRFPMLVAPYLSSATLDRLASEGVSGIDLSGNGVVTVPGEWLVMRTGNENLYPSSAPIKNIYRGRSSLVCRALILRPKYPSVGAIVDALRSDSGGDTGVTQATVSKVLKTLEEELLVTRTAAGSVMSAGEKQQSRIRNSGIRLTQPGELLDRLVRSYQAPKATRALRGAPTRDTADAAADTTPMAIVAAAAQQAGVRYAIDLTATYAPFPGNEETPIYVESLAPIMDSGVIREDTRFATVRLIESGDPTAYFDTRLVGGTSRVSPIQVYLELANGTKREREIAGALRTRILEETSGEVNARASDQTGSQASTKSGIGW
jgi:DNA-binding transcriptional ArsR family regulator